MKEDQKVYKLVGPVLIHVDLEEAKSNGRQSYKADQETIVLLLVMM